MSRLIVIAAACMLAASCRTTRHAEHTVSHSEVDSAASVAVAVADEAIVDEIRIDSVILQRDTAGTVTVSARGISKLRIGRRAAKAVVAGDTVSRRDGRDQRVDSHAQPTLNAFPTASTIVCLIVCLILIVILKWKLK